MTGCQLRWARLNRAEAPMMTRILKRAEPTMVPAPMSAWLPGLRTAINEVKSSGALEPTAMKVAPATSEGSLSFLAMMSRDSTKYSSQMTARR